MSVYKDFAPIDLEKIKTYELASRPSKVTVGDFARPLDPDASLRDFLDHLPDILAVKTLREIAARIRRARDLNKPVIWGIGGHVVKTGLAPILIDLMRHGYLSALAANGQVIGVTVAESARRGRIYTAAPSSLQRLLRVEQVEARGTPAPRMTPDNYGQQSDDLRRRLAVAQVVCVVSEN